MARRCDIAKDDIWNGKSTLTTSNTNIKNSVNTVRNIFIDFLNEIECHIVCAVFNNDNVFEVSGDFTKGKFFFGGDF